MPIYQALVDEWNGYKAIVKSLSHGSPSAGGKGKAWQPYEDSKYRDSDQLSKQVKFWLAERPKHLCEAGLFKSKRKDGEKNLFFLAWKTNDPSKKCISHSVGESGALHGWFELETSRGFTSSMPKDEELLDLMPARPFDVGIDIHHEIIYSLRHTFNVRMIKKVYGNGQCLRLAKSEAKREEKMDGKSYLEVANAVISLAGGAKPGSVKPGVSRPNEAIFNSSKLNWKGYGQQLGKLYKDEIPKPFKLGPLDSLPVSKEIYDAGGDLVGVVNHFD
jgi:hypothetical protein